MNRVHLPVSQWSSLACRVTLVVAAVPFMVCIMAGTVSAAASYYVYHNGPNQSSGTTPQRLAVEYPVGDNRVRAHAAALPGSVSGLAEVESFFSTPFSDGAGSYAQAQASTDDFVISGGPATSVTCTFYFQASAGFSVYGGYPQSSTGASVNISFQVGGVMSAFGNAWSNRSEHGGNGVFSGSSATGMGQTVALTGVLPVGVPFGVNLNMQANAATYGNSSFAPALASGRVGVVGNGPGLAIGDGTGRVMDLPPGYTVDSPSWGVANNQVVPTLNTPLKSSELRFDPATPNPSAGLSRLSFELPQSASVTVSILDLQGRAIRTLAAGTFGAGRHACTWDGTDQFGHGVAPGVYLASVRSESWTSTQRIVRTR